MRRVLSVLVVAITVSVPSALAARGLPKVLTGGNPMFQFKPGTIGFTGDGSIIVGGSGGTSARHPGHLHWTTYNQRQGVAIGTAWINDCTPDCVHGDYSPHRLRIRVFQVREGHFRLLAVRYRYQGRNQVQRFAAFYSQGFNGPGSGFWFYAICGVTPGVHC